MLTPLQMEEAIKVNMAKVMEEKKAEEVQRKKDDQLAGVSKDLIARIRAKEAKKIAQKMVRDPEKDKEVRTFLETRYFWRGPIQ